MDILIKIFAYAFGAFLVLGILSLTFMLVGMCIAFLRGKSPSGTPWWVIWSAIRDD